MAQARECMMAIDFDEEPFATLNKGATCRAVAQHQFPIKVNGFFNRSIKHVEEAEDEGAPSTVRMLEVAMASNQSVRSRRRKRRHLVASTSDFSGWSPFNTLVSLLTLGGILTIPSWSAIDKS